MNVRFRGVKRTFWEGTLFAFSARALRRSAAALSAISISLRRCLSSNSLLLSRVSKFWTWRLSTSLAKGASSLAQRDDLTAELATELEHLTQNIATHVKSNRHSKCKAED